MNNSSDLKDFQLTQLSPNCGAEISGIDLSQTLKPDLIQSILAALGKYGVLFFRNQSLTPEEQKAFGQNFGKLHIHPAWPHIVEGHPEIMDMVADENSVRVAGEKWHTDVSCDAEPPLGSILYMLEAPPTGGDTLFSSMYAAYDALSIPMQKFLADLTAVHDGEQVYRRGYDNSPKPDGATVYPKAEHPIVRTHPVSGRKALYVNRTFTSKIAQLNSSESSAILEMLYTHLEQPLFQCRFSWESGSVAFWDNRCVQHLALWDYYPHRRRSWRVTIKGEKPE